MEIAFDSCQCQLIQSRRQTEDQLGKCFLENDTLSWIKINELCIGRCTCPRCEGDYIKASENRRNDVKETNINLISKEFVTPSIKNYGEDKLLMKNCLDVYETKLNIVEAAFETAESIASLGAIVSI